MDPVNVIVAGLNTTIRLFEVSHQLQAVDEQARDLLITTQHIDRNINEARRLSRLKANFLSHHEKTWIDGTVLDTENALREIATLIEPARVDRTTKDSINLRHRLLWVFRESPKVQHKHQKLLVCHQSLMTVIHCLHGKNEGGGTSRVDIVATMHQQSPPPYHPDMALLFEWRKSRRRQSNTETRSSSESAAPDQNSEIRPTGNEPGLDRYSSLTLPEMRSTGFDVPFFSSERKSPSPDCNTKTSMPNLYPLSNGRLAESTSLPNDKSESMKDSFDRGEDYPEVVPAVDSGLELVMIQEPIGDTSQTENTKAPESMPIFRSNGSYRRSQHSWLTYHALQK